MDLPVPSSQPGNSAPEAAGDVYSTTRPCPECGQSLAFADAMPGLFSECPCGGVFVAPECFAEVFESPRTQPPQHELRALKKERHAHYRSGPVRYRRCAICLELMQRRNFCDVSGLIVDVCFAHGTWFPSGTFSPARRFVEHGGFFLMHRARTLARAPARTGAVDLGLLHARRDGAGINPIHAVIDWFARMFRRG